MNHNQSASFAIESVDALSLLQGARRRCLSHLFGFMLSDLKILQNGDIIREMAHLDDASAWAASRFQFRLLDEQALRQAREQNRAAREQMYE